MRSQFNAVVDIPVLVLAVGSGLGLEPSTTLMTMGIDTILAKELPGFP